MNYTFIIIVGIISYYLLTQFIFEPFSDTNDNEINELNQKISKNNEMIKLLNNYIIKFTKIYRETNDNKKANKAYDKINKARNYIIQFTTKIQSDNKQLRKLLDSKQQ